MLYLSHYTELISLSSPLLSCVYYVYLHMYTYICTVGVWRSSLWLKVPLTSFSSVARVAATSGGYAIQAIVAFTVTTAIFKYTWRNYLGLFAEVPLVTFWTVTFETTVPLNTSLSIQAFDIVAVQQAHTIVLTVGWRESNTNYMIRDFILQ